MNNNFKTIKNELDKVQSLILENNYLQSKYPDKKEELELGLYSLKSLESEMFEALEKECVNLSMETYVISLKGNFIDSGFIPMKQFGEILINSQNLITSLASRPLDLNQSPSKDIVDDTEMFVAATCSGSLKILIVSESNYNENSQNLNIAFDKLVKISKLNGNLDDLALNCEFGKKQISNYKKLLYSLSKLKLDMEVKKSVKDNENLILFNINSFNYGGEKLNEESVEIKGVIKSVDLYERLFKLESYCSENKMIIECYFNKNFEKQVISNLNNNVLIRIKKMEEFSRYHSNCEYELLEIRVNN